MHPGHRSLRLVLRSKAESFGEVNSVMGIVEARRLLKEKKRKRSSKINLRKRRQGRTVKTGWDPGTLIMAT